MGKVDALIPTTLWQDSIIYVYECQRAHFKKLRRVEAFRCNAGSKICLALFRTFRKGKLSLIGALVPRGRIFSAQLGHSLTFDYGSITLANGLVMER